MALILDTGPLLAALDRTDQDHSACLRLIQNTSERRIIPAPVLVEVDYWIATRLRDHTFLAFLEDIESGAYSIEALVPED